MRDPLAPTPFADLLPFLPRRRRRWWRVAGRFVLACLNDSFALRERIDRLHERIAALSRKADWDRMCAEDLLRQAQTP